MSKLSAVNTMLSAIGEQPVNSIRDSGSVDAITAIAILDNTSKEVQMEGWAFNTIFNKKMTPATVNGESFYSVPSHCLTIDTSGSSAFLNLVQRGGRLFDPVGTNGTPLEFDIGSVYPILYVTYSIEMLFDDDSSTGQYAMPPVAQNYITKRAARVLVDKLLGDPTLIRSAMIDEGKALELMKRTESNNGDYGIFNTLDAFSTLSRRINYGNSVRYGSL